VRTPLDGRLAERPLRVHAYVGCDRCGTQRDGHASVVVDGLREVANRQVEDDLVVAHHDKGQLSVQADFVLHTPDEFSSGHIQERPGSGQRVWTELLAQTQHRRPQPLQRNASAAELGQKTSLDHLAPGHGLRATGVGAEDWRVVDAAASVAVDPSAGGPRWKPRETIHVRVGVDRSIE
jgi:hypothetical protein